MSETSRANSQDESGVDRLPHPLSLTHVDENKHDEVRNSANGIGLTVDNFASRGKCVQTPPPAVLGAGQSPTTRGQFATIGAQRGAFLASSGSQRESPRDQRRALLATSGDLRAPPHIQPGSYSVSLSNQEVWSRDLRHVQHWQHLGEADSRSLAPMKQGDTDMRPRAQSALQGQVRTEISQPGSPVSDFELRSLGLGDRVPSPRSESHTAGRQLHVKGFVQAGLHPMGGTGSAFATYERNDNALLIPSPTKGGQVVSPHGSDTW